MGRYISQRDMEAVFGAENVAAWSNLDNTQADASDDRIAAAIAYAESFIDDRFRGSRYAVPLQGAGGTPAVLIDWAAKLAGIWLYESRGMGQGAEGSQLNAMKKAVQAEMAAYLAGQCSLSAAPAGTNPSAPVVVRD